ncbi:hypothetical protein J4G02_18380, partial [Candidatus Poribacteria bacterium]|nr:hypothetical protein [Candidatus Poribacteria bacterium]
MNNVETVFSLTSTNGYYMMQFTDTLIESYEKHAHQRESSTTDEFKKRERSEFLKLLKAERRKTILEIGCGPGRDAQFFQ